MEYLYKKSGERLFPVPLLILLQFIRLFFLVFNCGSLRESVLLSGCYCSQSGRPDSCHCLTDCLPIDL